MDEVDDKGNEASCGGLESGCCGFNPTGDMGGSCGTVAAAAVCNNFLCFFFCICFNSLCLSITFPQEHIIVSVKSSRPNTNGNGAMAAVSFYSRFHVRISTLCELSTHFEFLPFCIFAWTPTGVRRC